MTLLSWLFAPVAGMMAGALPWLAAMLVGSAGYEELVVMAMLMAAVLILWIGLALTIGWARPRGQRRTFVLVSLALVLIGMAGPYLVAGGDLDVTTVERVF